MRAPNASPASALTPTPNATPNAARYSIQGFEHAREVTYPLQASTCCKHFIANELEHWNNSDRQQIDVFVPQQDLVDSYLPSFQDCVTEGKASGIMCSYNQVSFGDAANKRAPKSRAPARTKTNTHRATR